jgi:hypothetical protein
MSRVKLYYYAITLTFVCLAIIFVWRYKGEENPNLNVCLEMRDMAFSGLIKYAFNDIENKGFYTLIIQGRIGEYRYVNNYGLVTPEAYIEVGDSIFKYKDTFRYRIVKNAYRDSIIVIDRTTEIDCN